MSQEEQRRSKTEMYPIIEAWQNSGQTKQAFCKDRGIPKSIFFYWYKQYKTDQGQGGFVPIKIKRGTDIPAIIEIEYPNGIVLRLPGQTSSAIVREYLQ